MKKQERVTCPTCQREVSSRKEETTMEVNTRVFEANHGKLPRGWGNWAFAPTHNTKSEDMIWVTETFQKARATAVKLAKERGFTQLVVLP